MPAMPSNHHFVLPGFAGVALADILANSAAIIILLITISLNVKNNAENEKIEKAKDVAILLSREIASSVVLNALPSSSPARLHSYTESYVDVYPRHRYMPILELHDDGIHNFYTKEKWLKSGLLKSDNTLDRYLDSLSEKQKKNMRLDIYSIENFYILMSILKSHNFTIRHWHFKGEVEIGQDDGLIIAQLEDSSIDRIADEIMPSHDKHVPNNLPGDITINTINEYSYDFHNAIYQQYGTQNLNYKSHDKSSLKYISKKSKAVYTQDQFVLSKAEILKEADEFSEIKSMDYRNILAFLFDVMIEIQYKADNDDYDALANLSLENAMLNYIYTFPKLKEYTASLIEKIFNELSGIGHSGMTLELEPEAEIAAVNVSVNERLNKVVIQGVANVDEEDNNPDILIRLSLFPAAYNGVILPINQKSLFLFSHENFDREGFKWRLITLINTGSHQSHIGFVYSKFDRDNQLVIKAEENMVMVNNQPLYPMISINNKRHGNFLFALYGMISLLVIFLITRKLNV